ncbi:nucleotide exchange factor SIL1 [Scleropages formosus]|uniref:Nucleotide exchange factor SIL1 n=1 Tax=Scleropages formosus TaxID=113540 RepID=A0A8C9VCK8_SCLFO|nr:nucleotide exchange factor SIL1 [Scleropages formosus]
MAADRRELLLGRWTVVTLLLSVLCSHLVVATSEKLPRTLSALSVVEGSEPSDVDEEAEVDDEGDPEDLEVFQPTHRWQTLRPGQAVPAGSHVRLNLQTGQREVKLDEEALKYWRNGKRQGMANTRSSSFTAQELKEALKKFKEEGTEQMDEERQKEEADLRSRFRSLDELKKDMAQLDMLVETDFQVMSRLMAQLNRSSATVEEKVSALLDLEYLVHQVDNAQDLVSMGGMKLVMDALNSTDVRLQESAAFVLGSALSGNPRVQVEAVEGGALQKLITLLATDRPLSVKKKVLFAVSSLLRNFPFAQSRFLKLGGVQVLGDLFRFPAGALLRVRIVTLLYDMLVEKELISEAGPDPLPDSSYQERLRQYAQVSLLPLLAEQGWCRLVPELLASPEHDWREKALRTLLAMMPRCRATYQMDPQLGHALGALQQQYRELALGEQDLGEDDRYFGEILELLDTVLLKVR